MDIRPPSRNLPVPVSRAIVPVAAKTDADAGAPGHEAFDAEREARRTFAYHRAGAPFLAHLIATHLHVPQARVRRRSGPEGVSELYRAAMEGPGLASLGFSATI